MSAAEVFANIAAVRLSCWSAIEGVISMSTIVGRDGVVVGESGGLFSFSSVFICSVSDGGLVGFVAMSVGSRKGAFGVLEVGRGPCGDVTRGVVCDVRCGLV